MQEEAELAPHRVGRVFREPWDETGELDDPWVHGVLIGGMASPSDRLGLAHDYAEAAGNLVEAALASGEPWRLCFPIFYLYRHALELYLKHALPQSSSGGHDLSPLVREFEEFLRTESRGAMPVQVRDDLLTLAAMDPNGQSFRYTDTSKGQQRPPLPGEYWVSLRDLRQLMDAVLWPNGWWRSPPAPCARRGTAPSSFARSAITAASASR